MISLARSSIIIDWRRYVTIVSMLTLTGLLLMVPTAFFLGTVRMDGYSVMQSQADLWVTAYEEGDETDEENVEAGDDALLWLHPNVVDVQMQISGSYARDG